MAMNKRYDWQMHQEQFREPPPNINFLITTKGEVVPFEWLGRLSLKPFDNIDQFADTLTSPPNELNEIYAILTDGTNCSFDLMNVSFTQHISDTQNGQYLPTDTIKKLLMIQFAQTNKEIPNDRDQERTSCHIEDEGTV